MTKQTKRRHGRPDPFQYLEVDAAPATEPATHEALRDFIEAFVAPAKRERAALFMLDPGKRARGLSQLFGWLDRGKTRALDGATGFPQNIAATLGRVPGLFVDHQGSCRLTAPEAAVLGHEDSLFVSDDRMLALVFAEIGCPTLCSNGR
jgi:hypothetical protein